MKTTVSLDLFMEWVNRTDREPFQWDSLEYIYEYLTDLESDLGEELEFYPLDIHILWCELSREQLEDYNNELGTDGTNIKELSDEELLEYLIDKDSQHNFHKVKDNLFLVQEY